jgi:hypothetical protein
MSIVLVVGRTHQRPSGGGLTGLWGALAAEVERVRRELADATRAAAA